VILPSNDLSGFAWIDNRLSKSNAETDQVAKCPCLSIHSASESLVLQIVLRAQTALQLYTIGSMELQRLARFNTRFYVR
jgi:hypothetical protein